MALPATLVKREHGSPYGADGIYYPAKEERVVPRRNESGLRR